MIGLRFLLLCLFVWRGAGLSALGGGGYSIAFQSFGYGTDVASISNLLDCSQTYWPTAEFTLSYWQKCQQSNFETLGISCGANIFIQNHTKTSYGQILAPSLSTSALTMNTLAFYDKSGAYPYSLPPPGLFKWNFFVYQYQASSGNLTVYMNGVFQSTITLNKGTTLQSRLYNWCPNDGSQWSFTLSRNFFKPIGAVVEEASGRGFQGYWDDIAMWNRSLTPAEIQTYNTTKLRGDEDGLLLYYDMNTPSDTVIKNMAFTGSQYDLLLGRTKGTVLYFDNQLKSNILFTKPVFSPVTPPIQASATAPPLLVFAVPYNNTRYLLAIDRPTTGTILKLDTVPTFGDLYNTDDLTTTTGGPLVAGSDITHPTGALIFAYSATFSNTTFNFTVDGAVSTANVHSSTPPQVESVAFNVPASGFVPMTVMAQDPIGLGWQRRVTHWPITGTLWNIDRVTNKRSTVIDAANPYIFHSGGYFGYEAPKDPVVTTFTLIYENDVGLASAETVVTLTVSPTNYPPIILDDDVNCSQTESVIIPLTYYDENDDIVTLTITTLPQSGQLFHVFPNGSVGEEITEVFNPFDAGTPVRPYATRVIGVSSYFGEDTNYHPNQTLGPRDVIPFGDSVRANSFLTINGVTSGVRKGGTPPLNYTYDPNTWFTNFGYTEYLEWEFGSIPLYALEFTIGMCRGPGSVVFIKAWSPRNRWETIYAGKADTNVLAQRQYWTFSPNLCRTNFATNKLRVEYDTRTIGDWAETDYVQYSGTTERTNAVLYYDELFDDSTQYKVFRVLYKPRGKFVGNDSFTYQANDCPFDRFHATNNSRITINVTAVSLAPEINVTRPGPPMFASLGSQTNIRLAFFATTPNGDPIFNFTIVSLPKYGSLEAAGQKVTKVPWNVTRGEVVYVSDLYSWNLQPSDSFDFTASGATKTSAPATLFIELRKADGESPVLAWIVLFAIAVVCSLSYAILLSRREQYPLRTLSLTLNLLVTTATTLTINIPLHIISFAEGYDCGFYYWSYMLFPPFFSLAVVVAIYRQRHMFRLEKVKKKLSREGSHEDALDYLRYLKAATSERRMAILAGLGVLVFIVIAAALTNVAESTVGYYYCHSPAVILYSLLVYWLVGCACVSAGLWYIRNDHEFTGFRRNVFYLLAYGLSLGVLYTLLITAVASGDQFHSFALLLCLILLCYQFMAVLRPCFLTFAFLRKTVSEEEGLEPLSEIIITQKGFAWFLEFCLVEFSQESPLCWRAIQNFKVKTSYAAMRDIYSKYFAPNAPLAVNLSSRSLKDMQQTCAAKTEDTPLQELQSIFNLVQVELMQLMQEDSYLRFVTSSYYRRFKKGERVPRRAHTHTPSTDSQGSGNSGTPRVPGSSGSKGSRGQGSKGSKTTATAARSPESQGEKDSKGGSIDPLTGGWAYESGDEPVEASARPASPTHAHGSSSSSTLGGSRHSTKTFSFGMADLETVRESHDEMPSPSATEHHEEGTAIEMSSRKMMTAEEEGLKETLIFNSNPLSKKSE